MPIAIDITQYELYQEGEESGLAKGLAKGIAKGKAEGKAEGIAEGRLKTAVRMLEAGKFSIADIAYASELSEAEVEEIRKNRKL